MLDRLQLTSSTGFFGHQGRSKRAPSTALSCLGCLAVVGIPAAQDRAAFPLPEELADDGQIYSFVSGREIVAGARSESLTGRDLNGDGDRTDELLVVFDVATGAILEDLRLDCSDVLQVDGRDLVYGTDESATGIDVNGDGDTNDFVHSLWSGGTGQSLSLGFADAGGVQLVPGSDLVLAFANEAADAVDHDRDGDVEDYVLFVGSRSTGAILPTPFASTAFPDFDASGSWVTFSVCEAANASVAVDLNGDGDTLDSIVVAVQRATGAVRVVPVAGTAAGLIGNWLILDVNEQEDGRDLDLDGVLEPDAFGVAYELTTRRRVDLGTQPLYRLENESAGLLLNSALESQPANTLVFFDPADGSLTDLGPLGTVELLDSRGSGPIPEQDGHVFFRLLEVASGTDWNGDGDTEDALLGDYDLTERSFLPLPIPYDTRFTPRRLTGGRVLATIGESVAGIDRNGDGELDDYEFVVHDPATSVTARSSLFLEWPLFFRDFGTRVDARGNVIVLVNEAATGRDLDADGAADSLSNVYVQFDPDTLQFVSLGLQSGPDIDTEESGAPLTLLDRGRLVLVR